MIQRFLQNRLEGHITVYAALSLILVMSLVCACIRSARVSLVKAEIDAGCVLSEEAVFSEYCNGLLEEFNILALKKSDMLNRKLNWFLGENLQNSEGAEFLSSDIQNYSMMTGDRGANLYNQIMAYMNYGVYSDIIDRITGAQKEAVHSKAAAEVTDYFVQCQNRIFEQDKDVLALIELVEGIRVNDMGFEVANDRPVCTGTYFAKAAVGGDVSMETAAIDRGIVYEVVTGSGKYTNICGLLDDMLEDIEEFQAIAEEEDEETAKEVCGTIYQKNVKDLKNVLNEVHNKLLESLEQAADIGEQKEEVTGTIDSCRELLKEKRADLNQELYERFHSDLGEMEEEHVQGSGLCDMELVRDGLEHNRSVLESVQGEINALSESLEVDRCDQLAEQIAEYKEHFKLLDNSGLRFNYSNVSFEGNKSGIGKIKELYNSMKQGLSGIVLEDRSVSKKKLEIRDLADREIPESTSESVKGVEAMELNAWNTARYDEYLLQNFTMYTDVREENKGDALLDYSLEYILCGEESDRGNLDDVILRLSLIREGVNMTYLVTNTAKRSQAMELALALVGFSGNMGVVKAAQYVIMAAWAYGEAVIDLRKLLDGKKLELVKNDESWELSLEKLLVMDFGYDQAHESSRGFAYEDYLRTLLFVENMTTKCYRTMAAMEMRMIECGNQEFRMRDYLCGCKGTAEFRIVQTGQLYTQEIEYRYY